MLIVYLYLQAAKVACLRQTPVCVSVWIYTQLLSDAASTGGKLHCALGVDSGQQVVLAALPSGGVRNHFMEAAAQILLDSAQRNLLQNLFCHSQLQNHLLRTVDSSKFLAEMRESDLSCNLGKWTSLSGMSIKF